MRMLVVWLIWVWGVGVKEDEEDGGRDARRRDRNEVIWERMMLSEDSCSVVVVLAWCGGVRDVSHVLAGCVSSKYGSDIPRNSLRCLQFLLNRDTIPRLREGIHKCRSTGIIHIFGC